MASSATASRRDSLHLRACAARLRIHPARWNNCNYSSSEAPPEPPALDDWHDVAERLFRSLSARNAHVVLLGDSTVRDLFVASICLLDAFGGLTARPDFKWIPHPFVFNGIMSAHIKNTSHARLTFVWAHTMCNRITVGQNCRPDMKVGQRQNYTRLVEYSLTRIYGGTEYDSAKWLSSVANASLVLYGGMAHAQNEAQVVGNLEMTERWWRANRQSQTSEFVLIEQMPAHFPIIPFGEYDRHVHRNSSQMQCATHNPSLNEAHPEANYRRDAVNAYAVRNRLRMLPTWDAAVRASNDHVNRSVLSTEVGALDCRHWCNPGPTTLRLADGLAHFLQQSGPAAPTWDAPGV